MAKPDWIQPLSSAARVRLALVTGSGFGKTVFCGTAPRALFLTTDPEGTVSAKRMGSTAEEWKITSWQDEGGLTEAYDYMLKEGCKEYDWLIHDNATEEQNYAMYHSIAGRLARRPTSDPDVPEQSDYQKMQLGFINMQKRFISLPVHQIWTIHRKWFDPENGEEGFWSANIQGQQGAIAEQFLGYMNMRADGEVVTNKAGETVRRLFFSQYKQYRGKDRYQAMGRYQDDLDVPKMMSLIKAKSPTTRRTAAKKTTATRRRRAA
jgi:AAA domain